MAASGWAQVSEYPSPLIREQQTVVINGRPEVWRLQWTHRPKPYCDPNDDSWMTCPCLGVAFGESGDLILTRSVEGVEVDRLPLAPLFKDHEIPVPALQRWEPDWDKDLKNGLSSADGLAARAARRPTVKIMEFADYDHDGQKSEFYLEIDTQPCFHTYGIVLGVSNKNPRLHAFGTASHPDKAVEMDSVAWEALRKATGPVEVTVVHCGDHGAETETALKLHWNADGIDGATREYSCPENGGARRLLNEAPLP